MNFIENDFLEVSNILHEREKCNVICRTDSDKIIFNSDDNSQLDLCMEVLKNKLIIRRVALKNKHMGTFSILFEWFSNYCKTKNISYIILQTIVSEEMLSFAVKNNFEPVPGKVVKDGQIIWGDYEYTIINEQG